jgi:hypothetical protein
MKSSVYQMAMVVATMICQTGRPVRGDSPIGAGDRVAIIGNTFADQLRIHGYLETMLLQRWPNNPPSIRNLAWGGDMLSARDRPTNFPTEESTLRDHRTDVIVACFGMGESFAGEEGLVEFRREVDAFLDSHAGKRYNGDSQVRLILVSPIAYEDLGETTPRYEQRNRELAAYSRVMREATAGRVPFVDLYGPSRYLMDELAGPERKGPYLTTNGIHLNRLGYWAISSILYRGLVEDDSQGADTTPQPWHVFIDAKTGRQNARGVRVSELSIQDDTLSLRVEEQTGPNLPPPCEEDLPPQMHHQRDSLTVVNLGPGNYTLTVDGETVVSGSHKDWAEGIAIDSSPAHREAEAVRQSINDKNLQFTYSWKALNQVHIVGERKSSPSGRALPGEVIEFKKLADRRDQQLRQELIRRTRIWRLEQTGP